MGIAWNFDLGMDYSLLHDLERTPCFGKGKTTIMQLKFGFFEKATKFEKIFVVLLTRASCSVRAKAYLSKI